MRGPPHAPAACAAGRARVHTGSCMLRPGERSTLLMVSRPMQVEGEESETQHPLGGLAPTQWPSTRNPWIQQSCVMCGRKCGSKQSMNSRHKPTCGSRLPTFPPPAAGSV